MSNNLTLSDFIRIRDFLSQSGCNLSDFLSLVLQEKLKVFAYIDSAELVEVDSARISKVIGIKSFEFLQVHPHAFYSPFVNGNPITGNFLLTAKPIESWLPDYDWEGLHYLTDPSSLIVENLFVLKDSGVIFSFDQTTKRSDDIKVEISKDWSLIKIDDEIKNIQGAKGQLLRALWDAKAPLSAEDLRNKYQIEGKISLIIRERDEKLRSLMLFGDGNNFEKRLYSASYRLINAVFVPRSDLVPHGSAQN